MKPKIALLDDDPDDNKIKCIDWEGCYMGPKNQICILKIEHLNINENRHGSPFVKYFLADKYFLDFGTM